jgi:hypothetical protein
MQMSNQWTFGIVTDGKEQNRLGMVINSIIHEKDTFDEIIVIGGELRPIGADVWIPFNENIKQAWITKKKNLIAEIASNDRICIMHDYVALQKGWRDGYSKFFDMTGGHWKTATNHILNKDGERFRDWCAIYNNAWMEPPIDNEKPPYGESIGGHLLQYHNNKMGRWQYYSGAYFCAHKLVMLSIPLNEDRVWGTGEDVEWCRRLYKEYGQDAFNFNPHSTVQFLKPKQHAPWESFSPI